MNSKNLIIKSQGPVLEVTLNRPDLHNAFDEHLITELTACFEWAGENPDIRVVLLGGEGASFCAGADLGWMGRMIDYSADENRADARKMQEMFAMIACCPKPTVARVHGPAIGGGAGLAAVCDIAIASTKARFVFSEVRLGLVPSVIAPYVVDKIGAGQARALFLTGESIDALEALRIGLVQRVVLADELDSTVEKKIDALLQARPNAVMELKRLLRAIANEPTQNIAEITIETIASIRVGAEAQEGIRAFLSKSVS